MDKEIKFKAVSLKAMFISLLLIIFLMESIGVIVLLFNIYKIRIVVIWVIVVAIIIQYFLRKQEKMISFLFKDKELWIGEEKVTSATTNQSISKIAYSAIHNYNIYSLTFFSKKLCYIVRVKSDKNYGYCLNWASATNKGEFKKDECEEIKKIFGEQLRLNRKIEFIDRLHLLMYSIIPQILIIACLVTSISLIFIFVFFIG